MRNRSTRFRKQAFRWEDCGFPEGWTLREADADMVGEARQSHMEACSEQPRAREDP